MSRCKLRTPWPIHFKLRAVIGIDSLMVCILFGEISIFLSRVMGLYSSMNCNIYTIFIQLKTTFFEKSVKTINSNNNTKFEVNWWRSSQFTNFHSRVMGLYSSNCRRFFVCRAVNWELLGQFTSNFAQLLELIVLRSVYFLVKFRFFIPELWDFIHQIVGDFS
jgi:hypothetical protein